MDTVYAYARRMRSPDDMDVSLVRCDGSVLFVARKGTKSNKRGEPKGDRPAANKGHSGQEHEGQASCGTRVVRLQGQPESAVQEPRARRKRTRGGQPAAKAGARALRDSRGREQSRSWRTGSRASKSDSAVRSVSRSPTRCSSAACETRRPPKQSCACARWIY